MSGFVVTEDGRMVDAEVERIAALIQDYDPRLELAWIPPEQREVNEAHPFAVLYNNPNGMQEIVFRLKENEIDHRVIKRLWENDSNTGTNVLDQIEAEENARRAVELKRQMDEAEERQELAAWMLQARPGAISPGGTKLE